MIHVAIVNASSVLRDTDLEAALGGLQRQLTDDFAAAWGVDAHLSFVAKGAKPPTDQWWLAVLDDSDQQGALGYHDLTTDGLPIGKVFAGTDLKYGKQWTVTASHELLEMLADPDIDLAAFVEQKSSVARLYAYEVCDPVEADELGYDVDGVRVSSFVYPAWFQSFRMRGSTRFDHGGRLSEPFELAPGGYCSVYEVGGGSWRQVTRDGDPPRFGHRPRPGSRRERRRTSRSEWLRSTVATGPAEPCARCTPLAVGAVAHV